MNKKFIFRHGDETEKDEVVWEKNAIEESKRHSGRSYSSGAKNYLALLEENSMTDSRTQVTLHEKETELGMWKLQKELQEELEKFE